MDKHLTHINYFLFFLAGAVSLLVVLLVFPSGGFVVDEFNAWGFYFNHNSTDDYYCVWVDDVWHNKVADTEYHEACHALIDRDYDHFCFTT